MITRELRYFPDAFGKHDASMLLEQTNKFASGVVWVRSQAALRSVLGTGGALTLSRFRTGLRERNFNLVWGWSDSPEFCNQVYVLNPTLCDVWEIEDMLDLNGYGDVESPDYHSKSVNLCLLVDNPYFYKEWLERFSIEKIYYEWSDFSCEHGFNCKAGTVACPYPWLSGCLFNRIDVSKVLAPMKTEEFLG